MTKLANILFVAVLVVLVIGGVLAGLKHARNGLATTGLSEPVVWGLYVVCFVYFLGLGAGSLLVASLAWCSPRRDTQSIARVGSMVALVSLVLAGVFITLDLGRPDRAYFLMTKAQLQSPLVWDFLIVNIMIGLAALYTLLALRGEALRSDRHGLVGRLLTVGAKGPTSERTPALLRLFAMLMVVVVPVLYLLTVRVFSTPRARPDWNTTALGPLFLVSAVLSGVAAVLAVAGLSVRARGEIASHAGRWRQLCNMALVLIVVEAILTFAPAITMRQFDSPSRLEGWAGVGGSGVAELLVGMLIPAMILLLTRRTPSVLAALAGLGILTGLFMKRWHIIVEAMTQRALPLPKASYDPSPVEIGASVGLAAFGVLLVYLLLQFAERLVGPQASDAAIARGK